MFFDCWVVGMICWWISDRFLIDLGSKIYQTKAIENKMEVGMDFGWLLDRFVVDLGPQVGGQVGARLAPKSVETGYQDDVKKSLKM